LVSKNFSRSALGLFIAWSAAAGGSAKATASNRLANAINIASGMQKVRIDRAIRTVHLVKQVGERSNGQAVLIRFA
jgi:hypothetical protein